MTLTFPIFIPYFPCWHQSFDNPCFLHPRYTGKVAKWVLFWFFFFSLPFLIFILSWRVINEAMFVPMRSRIWNPTKSPSLLDEYHRAAYYALWLNVDYRCDQTVIRARAVIKHYCAALWFLLRFLLQSRRKLNRSSKSKGACSPFSSFPEILFY